MDAEPLTPRADAIGQPLERDATSVDERNLASGWTVADDLPIVVPLHAEELIAVPREVELGVVRLRTSVEEVPTPWETTVTRGAVSIERVPVGRVVDAAPEPRWDGDTLVVPVVEEEVVVTRRLVLREEVRLTRRATSERVSGVETVRRERIEVEQVPPAPGEGDSLVIE